MNFEILKLGIAVDNFCESLTMLRRSAKNVAVASKTLGYHLKKINLYPHIHIKFQRTVLITTAVLLSILLLVACGQVVAQRLYYGNKGINL